MYVQRYDTKKRPPGNLVAFISCSLRPRSEPIRLYLLLRRPTQNSGPMSVTVVLVTKSTSENATQLHFRRQKSPRGQDHIHTLSESQAKSVRVKAGNLLQVEKVNSIQPDARSRCQSISLVLLTICWCAPHTTITITGRAQHGRGRPPERAVYGIGRRPVLAQRLEQPQDQYHAGPVLFQTDIGAAQVCRADCELDQGAEGQRVDVERGVYRGR